MCKGEGAGVCVFRSVLFLFFAGGERLRGGGERGVARLCACVCGCACTCVRMRECIAVHWTLSTSNTTLNYPDLPCEKRTPILKPVLNWANVSSRT